MVLAAEPPVRHVIEQSGITRIHLAILADRWPQRPTRIEPHVWTRARSARDDVESVDLRDVMTDQTKDRPA